MTLRPFQKEAVATIMRHFNEEQKAQLRELVAEALRNAKDNGDFEPHGSLNGKTNEFIADDLATYDADIEAFIFNADACYDHVLHAELAKLVGELRP